MTKPNQKTRKRGFRVRKFIKNLSLLAVLAMLATAAGLVYLYATSLPLADSDRNSRLLDSQGEVIATFSAGGKTLFGSTGGYRSESRQRHSGCRGSQVL